MQEVAEKAGLGNRATHGVVGRVTGFDQQRQGRPAPNRPEEEIVRPPTPVSPYDEYVANVQEVEAEVPRGPALRGMAARVNANSVRSPCKDG